MFRAALTWIMTLTAFALGLASLGEVSMGQTTWVTKRVVVDDTFIDRNDAYSIIDPVWWTADVYGSVDTYESSLSIFSKPQRLIFAVAWYRSEVNNGGHHQFFYNSTGIVWLDALEAFQTVGLDQSADILRQAVGRFSHPPSQERNPRIEQLETDQPEFDDLDERFYDLEQSIDIDAKLMAYIKEHRSEFHFDGLVSVPK